MTSEEHALLITMFAKQAQQIKILETILTAKGIVEQDEIAAFATAAWADVPTIDAIVDSIADKYDALCGALGIKVDASVQSISDARELQRRRAT